MPNNTTWSRRRWWWRQQSDKATHEHTGGTIGRMFVGGCLCMYVCLKPHKHGEHAHMPYCSHRNKTTLLPTARRCMHLASPKRHCKPRRQHVTHRDAKQAKHAIFFSKNENKGNYKTTALWPRQGANSMHPPPFSVLSLMSSTSIRRRTKA